MSIPVKTAVYEGPLDLLLELIEKRKLLINDISLAQVADEYAARIRSMEALPLGETAEFVALAATLLLIKSRSLLPLLNLTDEESRDIKELQYRLALYQLIKEAARGLRGQLTEPPLCEGESPEPELLFVPDPSITLSGLQSAAHMLIEGFPQTLTLPKIAVKKILSLEEMIERLAERVGTALRLSFHQFSGLDKSDLSKRQEIIVSFLALLELVKQGSLKASQEGAFGDIMLESQSLATPSYE